MAIDLDSVFPRELPGSPLFSPFDPTCPSEMLDLSDLSATQVSPLGNNVGVGFDGSLLDLTSYDDPYFVDSLYTDSKEKFDKLPCNHLDQSPHADFCSQDSSWITTPVSLPLTPEGTAPNSPAMFLPCPSVSHTPLVQSPYPPSTSQVASSSIPLSPESLPSPAVHFEEEDKNLKEILSFFEEPDSAVAASGVQISTFKLPLSHDQQSTASNTDDCSSVYSLLSTPQSPLSPNLQSSPELLPRTYAPSDTIHALLASSYTQPSTPALTSPSSDSSHTPSITCSTDNSHTPSITRSTDINSCRKHSSSDSLKAPPAQKKRRVSASSRKERKREQNKTAALRYRQKKKEEKSEVEVKRMELEEKNMRLKSSLSSLEAEVAYLRKLWAEVERARTAQQTQH